MIGMRDIAGIVALTILIGWPGPAPADETEEEEDTSLRCINARSIRGADVIDDNHIVFEIQGRRLFLNVLPATCKGLSKDGRFSYDTYTRSLCARDKIRILKDSGNRVYETGSCSLGRFQPVNWQELEDFFLDRSVTPGTRKVEPAEVEEVVNDR